MGVSMGARVLGIVLMAATIGLASCQAFLTGPSDTPGEIAAETQDEG